jgi:FdhE protein
MRQTLQDQERLCDVQAALDDLCVRRPPLKDIATSFSLLLRARLAVAQALPKASLLSRQELDAAVAALATGRPLLGALIDSLANPTPELIGRFLAAARILLPAAAQAFPALAPELAKVAVRLDDSAGAPDRGHDLAGQLLAAIGPDAELAERPQTVEDLSKRLELSAPALHMCATETLLALLAHERGLVEHRVVQDAWRRGSCPVCGGGPDVGLLKEGKEDSEFLIAKAGQLWLHCGQCGGLWRFPRLRCVACGCEDPHKTELLVAEDQGEHERVHLCGECRTYLPTVNLVDRVDRVNLELLPIGLLHLDVLAQERGFSPLAPSPWNTL